MPRIVGDVINTMIMQDHQSDSELHLYYRKPSTRERIDYTNKTFQRRGRKMGTKLGDQRIRYGARICTGFREGDFVREHAGSLVPISSDPASPHYRKDWKSILLERDADVFELLAIRVFDAPVEGVASGGDDDDNAEPDETLPGDEPAEETEPDPLSSSQTT